MDREKKKLLDAMPSAVGEVAELTKSESLGIVARAMQTGDLSVLDGLAEAMQRDASTLDDENKNECISVGEMALYILPLYGDDSIQGSCAILLSMIGAYMIDGDPEWLTRIDNVVDETRGDEEDEDPVSQLAKWCKTAASEMDGLSVYEQSILQEVGEGLEKGNTRSIEIVSPDNDWSSKFLDILFVGLAFLYHSDDVAFKPIGDHIEKVLTAQNYTT